MFQGKQYTVASTKDETYSAEMLKFLDDFYSVFWMTYRNNVMSMKVSIIPRSAQCTDDKGWGCMIRSGQMLISNTILRHVFSDGFSLGLINTSKEDRVKYLEILWHFMDNLNGADAVFSIGNIVELGVKFGMKAKDLYGSSLIIRILHKLNKTYAPFQNFRTVTFPEGIIFKSSILAKAFDIKSDKVDLNCNEVWKNSVFIMVSFRLGIKSISEEHRLAILRILDIPLCTGMIGGQNKSALYFIGYQSDKLIFLDPHVTQPAIRSPIDLWTEHLTYHYPTPLRLSINKLDTCVAYGKFSIIL